MRTMFVYRPSGSFYFRTQIEANREAQEEDYWRGQGYRVTWDEPETPENSGRTFREEIEP